MAHKIEKIGNAVVITDLETNVEVIDRPAADLYCKVWNGTHVSFHDRQKELDTQDEMIRLTIVETQDAEGFAFDLESIKLWYRSNLAFSSAGSSASTTGSELGTHLGAVPTLADLPHVAVDAPEDDPVSPGDTLFVTSLRVEFIRQGDNTWSLRPGSRSMQRVGESAPDFPAESFVGLRHETLDGRLFYADDQLNWILVNTAISYQPSNSIFTIG